MKNTTPDTEKLMELARKRVKEIFKENGLTTDRKIGLQKAIRSELVASALTGTINLKGDKK